MECDWYGRSTRPTPKRFAPFLKFCSASPTQRTTKFKRSYIAPTVNSGNVKTIERKSFDSPAITCQIRLDMPTNYATGGSTTTSCKSARRFSRIHGFWRRVCRPRRSSRATCTSVRPCRRIGVCTSRCWTTLKRYSKGLRPSRKAGMNFRTPNLLGMKTTRATGPARRPCALLRDEGSTSGINELPYRRLPARRGFPSSRRSRCSTSGWPTRSRPPPQWRSRRRSRRWAARHPSTSSGCPPC